MVLFPEFVKDIETIKQMVESLPHSSQVTLEKIFEAKFQDQSAVITKYQEAKEWMTEVLLTLNREYLAKLRMMEQIVIRFDQSRFNPMSQIAWPELPLRHIVALMQTALIRLFIDDRKDGV